MPPGKAGHLPPITGMLVATVIRDLVRLKETDAELRRSREQLLEAQTLARIGSWEWDVAADKVTWSDELFRIYGLEPGAIEPCYEGFLSRVHHEDRESVDARNRKAFSDHEPFEDVKRVVREDGDVFLMRTKGEVISDDEGNPVRLVGICEDVTDEVRAEEADARLAALVTSSQDAILSHDVDGVITTWNPGAERLYGYTAEEAIGARVDMLLPAARAEAERRMSDQLREGGRVDHYETQRLRKDGSLVDVSLSVAPILGPRGTLEGVSSIARDVTERRRFEERLLYLADHDALTGLFNRRRFEEELTGQLAHAERYGNGGVVLVLDIDNFKYVNDTLGHGSGDELLRSVARLLGRRMRGVDVVARLGGDEFAMIVPYAGADEARVVAEDLLQAVRHNALVAEGHSIRSTASIGAAIYDDRSIRADDLLAAANRAMHAAKDTGRDRYVLQTPDRWQAARRLARQDWEHRIHAALDDELFVLHCQPILDLASGEVSQWELLLRLEDEEGLVPPQAFLGVAERLGLVQAIDRWVVCQAIDLLAAHAHAGRELRLEANLSARSVGDRELTALIEREIASAGVAPGSLILEITETAAIANMDEARRFADELSAAGCSFALDDFGTGFGSFYYLKHLDADYLKIEGDFVSSPRERKDELVVEAIVHVASGLGKRTIAEYVTDADTVTKMRDLGVDYAQGFHVGRPFPVSELATRLDA